VIVRNWIVTLNNQTNPRPTGTQEHPLSPHPFSFLMVAEVLGLPLSRGPEPALSGGLALPHCFRPVLNEFGFDSTNFPWIRSEIVASEYTSRFPPSWRGPFFSSRQYPQDFSFKPMHKKIELAAGPLCAVFLCRPRHPPFSFFSLQSDSPSVKAISTSIHVTQLLCTVVIDGHDFFPFSRSFSRDQLTRALLALGRLTGFPFRFAVRFIAKSRQNARLSFLA